MRLQFSIHPTPVEASRKGRTNIPKLCPSDEVRMVDLALRINMLPRPDSHRIRRRDVDQGRLSRVGMRHPY